MKILIVDSNKANRHYLSQVLCNAGYSVIEAENGVESVASIKKYFPDIVLMGIDMPQMNGYQATKNIRQILTKEDLPILFLISDPNMETIDRCLESGGNDYFSTYFMVDILVEKIKQMTS